jgi:5'-3' exonuclease
MGIKNLGTLLKATLDPKTWETVSLEKFRHHRIAIDVLNNFHPLLVSAYGIQININPNTIPSHDVVMKTALGLLFRRIESLIGYGITPIMVMDGAAGSLKHETQNNRRKVTDKYADQMVDAEIRIKHIDKHIEKINEDISTAQEQSLPIDDDQVEDLLRYRSEKADLNRRIVTSIKGSTRVSEQDKDKIRIFCSYLGVPYIIAEGEAEKLCAQLVREGHARAALSNDTDMFAHGCPVTIKELKKGTGEFSSNVATVVILENVLSQLNLTYEQFVDLCIMAGTDYNDNVPNFGVMRCKKLIEKYHSLDEMPDEIDTSFLRSSSKAKTTLGPYKKSLLYNKSQRKDYKAIRREFLTKRQNIDPLLFEVEETNLDKAMLMMDDSVSTPRYAKLHSNLIGITQIKVPYSVELTCQE